MSSELERYSRQILFPDIGETGQQRLLSSHALVCGCGALGSVIADTLTRAGVGFLRIIDRDFVEYSNLQRQVLFDEQDVISHLPKAVAAVEKLRAINSDVTFEPVVADVDCTNIRGFCEDIDLIVDGTDNFEVRFLINDVTLDLGIPWVYGGCIGGHGQTMTIIPGETACLRCLIHTVPEPGTTETCDTAGILGPTVNVIASLECVSAIKILIGRRDLITEDLTIVDVWDGSYRRMRLGNLRDRSDCPACKQGLREWLSGEKRSQSTILCGRNAVQVAPQQKTNLDLAQLEQKLRPAGDVSCNAYLLRLQLTDPDYEVTVFRDGRAIIRGTQDVGIAKAVYSRYIGS